MPLTTLHPNTQGCVTAFSPIGGTSTGAKCYIPAPWRGFVKEVGFIPNSLVASQVTLAVAINAAQVSSSASTFTVVCTSTTGTFSSTNLYEGAVASVTADSFTNKGATYVNQGDTLQFTTSGGNASAIGFTCYAIIQRGGNG